MLCIFLQFQFANIENIGIIVYFYGFDVSDFMLKLTMVKGMNPFRKRTGIFPSYFTGRENELNELREIYESTRAGAAGHILIYGPKGIGKTCLLIKFEEQLNNVDGVYPVRIPLVEGKLSKFSEF